MSLNKISLPELGEGVTEGEILKIKVKEGESIVMDQVLLEVMTDKASMEVPSSIDAVIEKIEISEGDIVSVGAPLFTVKSQETPAEKTKEAPREKKENAPEKNKLQPKGFFKDSDFTLALPATRKLAEELGLNLKDISQEASPITREDLLKYVRNRLQNSSPAPQDFKADFEEEKRIPVKGIQRLMFESMSLSKASIPHFTIGEQAQVDYLVQLRTEMKNRLKEQGVKTGYLPFFIKALIPVIKEFPIFNSVYDPEKKEIVFKKNLNIGFAVDSPQGLLVPVIKEVQNKSLLEIIKELFELAQKTREASIERENLKGAGLTLTNLGSLGGIYGTPIIQAPEMAILAIYRTFKQAVKNERAEWEEKTFMNFSITCDHRFIDGATAVKFLRSFIQKVEEPSLLLL